MGRALVRELKTKSWQVFGAGRTTSNIPDEADLAVHFDADYEHSFESVVMRVAQETTELDLMVYAVGELAYDKLEGMGQDGWNKTLRSNLTGAYLASFYSLNLLKEGAHSVYIGAYLEHLRLPKMGAYVAAKAGLQELVTVLQKENRKHKFTLVRPGPVDTPFWEQVALKLPSDAKTPEVLAQAIISHIESGASGELNL